MKKTAEQEPSMISWGFGKRGVTFLPEGEWNLKWKHGEMRSSAATG